MSTPRLALLAAIVVAGLFANGPAQATSSSGVASQRQWGVMDKCVRQAITKYPDHTAADLAKRDEFTRLCQRNSRVPVREGLAPK